MNHKVLLTQGQGKVLPTSKGTHQINQKGEGADGSPHVPGLQLLSVMYLERDTCRRHQITRQEEAGHHDHGYVVHFVFPVRKDVYESAASRAHDAPPEAAEQPLPPVKVAAVLPEQLKADSIGHGGGCGVAAVYR